MDFNPLYKIRNIEKQKKKINQLGYMPGKCKEPLNFNVKKTT